MNKFDIELLKKKIEEKFSFVVKQIEYLGGGVDSNAYLVNNDYVFKIAISENSKINKKKKKLFSDFYKENKINNIEIPNIEFYYSDDSIRIVGYKIIEGSFINRNIYDSMNDEEQENFCKDVASFLKRLHEFSVDKIDLDKIDMREKMLKEIELIKKTIYTSLNEKEKKYIDRFKNRLINSNIFNDKKCICHIDFNPDHILIDENHKFKGVID